MYKLSSYQDLVVGLVLWDPSFMLKSYGWGLGPGLDNSVLYLKGLQRHDLVLVMSLELDT